MTIRSFLSIAVRTVNCVTCHRDGSLTYYDPWLSKWIEDAPIVQAHAMAVLPVDEADRVRRHMDRHAGVCA